MYSPSFDYVQQWQRGQAVVASNGQDRLDLRMTATTDHDMTSGSVTVTDAQLKETIRHRITNCTVAGRTLTIPTGTGATQGPLFISSAAANTQNCSVLKGETLYVIAPGEVRSFWNDPDVDTLTEIAGSGGGSLVLPTSKRKKFSGCSVRNSTVHVETLSEFWTASWDTEMFDVGGWHDGVNPSRLTVPAGVPRVKVTVRYNDNANLGNFANFCCAIRKNGSEVVYTNYNEWRDNEVFGDVITTPDFDVVEGDYFECLFCVWTEGTQLTLGTDDAMSFAIMATAEDPYSAAPSRDIVSNYISGTPAANDLIYEEIMESPVGLFEDFAGSYFHNGTNPSATTDFDVQVDGVSIGTCSVSSGGVATFTTSATDLTIDTGSYFSIVAPANLNSIADLAFTFRGFHA